MEEEKKEEEDLKVNTFEKTVNYIRVSSNCKTSIKIIQNREMW